jgi:hypothetical protein
MLSTTYQIAAQIAPQGQDDVLAGNIYTYLEDCLSRPSGFPPEMLAAWADLAPFIRPASYNPPSDPENEPSYFLTRIEQYKVVHQRLNDFKSCFSEHIDGNLADALDGVISLADRQITSLNASRLFHQGDKEKNLVKRIELYYEGIEVYSQCIIGTITQIMYLKARNSIPEPAIELLINSTKSLLVSIRDTSDALLAQLPPISVEHSRVKRLVHRIQVQIKASFWDIHRITHGFEPLGLMLSIGEPYPIVIESASAEGKAIRRMQDAKESDWVIVAEPNTEIDVDDLDAQLRACGYIN